MEINSVMYYGVQGDFRTVEKRITFDYDKGNDVTQVERHFFTVTLYTAQGQLDTAAKGSNIDQLA
jgi:hypothetical protein